MFLSLFICLVYFLGPAISPTAVRAAPNKDDDESKAAATQQEPHNETNTAHDPEYQEPQQQEQPEELQLNDDMDAADNSEFMEAIKQVLRSQLMYRQTGLDALYKDANFNLIHVVNDQDGNNTTMTVIHPADDPKYQQEIEDQGGFYALSHRWGNVRDYPPWEVGEFIKEQNGGRPADPVPMLPEKRDTVIALLKAHPGYWWIDVVCARVDTPLVIMGSIYRCCKTCIAMVDCPLDMMRTLSVGPGMKQIRETVASSCMQVQMTLIDVRYDPDRELVRTVVAPEAKAHYRMLNTIQPEIKAMRTLLECLWFDRVWTLQELVLPSKVMMVADQGGDAGVRDQVDISAIMTLGTSLVPADYDVYLDDATCTEIEAELEDLSDVLCAARKADGFMDGFDILSENRAGGRNDDRYKLSALRDIFEVMLESSTRSCMDPVDYVYGLLGLLDLDIPRMNDAQLVWQTFLSKLDERLSQMVANVAEGTVTFSISESAKSVDLTKANNVSDVYAGLLEITFDQQANHSLTQELCDLAKTVPEKYNGGYHDASRVADAIFESHKKYAELVGESPAT